MLSAKEMIKLEGVAIATLMKLSFDDVEIPQPKQLFHADCANVKDLSKFDQTRMAEINKIVHIRTQKRQEQMSPNVSVIGSSPKVNRPLSPPLIPLRTTAKPTTISLSDVIHVGPRSNPTIGLHEEILIKDIKKLNREEIEKYVDQLRDELKSRNRTLVATRKSYSEALVNVGLALNAIPLRGRSFETGTLKIRRNAIQRSEKSTRNQAIYQFSFEMSFQPPIKMKMDKKKTKDEIVVPVAQPTVIVWFRHPVTGITTQLHKSCITLSKTSARVVIERDSEEELHEADLRWFMYYNPEVNPNLAGLNERIACEKPVLSATLEKQLSKHLETSDINDVGSRGKTLLDSASQAGNTELVMWLLEKGASINIQDWHGWTPLMTAISAGKFETALSLVTSGADASIMTETRSTALHYLTQVTATTQPSSVPQISLTSSASIPLSVLNQNPSPDSQKRSLYTELLATLLQKKCDPYQHNTRGETPMHNAVNSNNLDCVVAFLRSTTTNPLADVSLENGDGLTPLHIAVQKANMEIIRELISAGADPIAYSPIGTPIDVAIDLNRKDIASYLKSKLPVQVFGTILDEHITKIISFLSPIEAIKARAISKRMLAICNQSLCGQEYWDKNEYKAKSPKLKQFFFDLANGMLPWYDYRLAVKEPMESKFSPLSNPVAASSSATASPGPKAVNQTVMITPKIDCDHVVSLLVMGNRGSGKTTFINSLLDTPSDIYFPQQCKLPPIARSSNENTHSKIVFLNGSVVKLFITEQSPSAVKKRFSSINGVILLIDLSSPESFSQVSSWFKDIKEYAPDDVTVAFVGSKHDDKRCLVNQLMLQKLYDRFGIQYFETSSLKDPKTVHIATRALCTTILAAPKFQGHGNGTAASNNVSNRASASGLIQGYK